MFTARIHKTQDACFDSSYASSFMVVDNSNCRAPYRNLANSIWLILNTRHYPGLSHFIISPLNFVFSSSSLASNPCVFSEVDKLVVFMVDKLFFEVNFPILRKWKDCQSYAISTFVLFSRQMRVRINVYYRPTRHYNLWANILFSDIRVCMGGDYEIVCRHLDND